MTRQNVIWVFGDQHRTQALGHAALLPVPRIAPDQSLPDGMPTIARPFNDAGYDTAWFGKWHLAGISEKQGRSALATVPRQKRGEFRTWIGYETDVLTDMLVAYTKAHARAGKSGMR